MSTGFEEIERLKKELEDAKKIIQDLEHDELTGLLTRQAFLHQAEVKVKENPQIAFGILAMDFENFKSTNSLYGEDKCNEFLAFVARKMQDQLKTNLIGRFGGDQFVVLFDSSKNYLEIYENKKNEILKDAPIPNQVVKFGIYTPIDKDSLMVRCCDRAFLAIRKIKGVYGQTLAFYEDSIAQQIVNEQKIIESMETSLKNGEFLVYYQPKHEAVTERIAGAEALVRWQHPLYGFMSPAQFIPLFERNGFITKLDTYILEKVCQDIARWQSEGLPLVPVSVNISRRDYMEPNCIEKQRSLIDQYKINHDLIHMEVTESMYSENTDLIITKVRDSQESGFLIEMDDFGAGYSSLGLLSSFPLDVIKLDITFVRNIDLNQIVIENIIKMAHRMGLITVAEGVETELQFKILRRLGCDLIQGYFFSKPIPVSEFESYLRHHTISSVLHSKKSTDSIVEKNDEEKMLMVANEISEGIPGGFFSYHADGDLEIISLNSELLSIYECSNAEEFRSFTKNTFKGMVHPEDYENVNLAIEHQITKDNNLDCVEYRIITKTGKIKYIQDFGRYVHTEKYGGIFYVFMYDITEDKRRKDAEHKEQLVKQELEKAAAVARLSNSAKNIFLNNLSEDLLPLVEEIINATKETETNVENVHIIKDCISRAQQAEEQLLGYINNLREMSKLEQGQIILQEIPTDITYAAERIHSILYKVADRKKVKLEYWSDIYNPYIYQDVIHTTDVVFNILLNAIKYTPEGGVVRFGLKQIPGKDDSECNVEFHCEDNGIGISKEFMSVIFDEFTREDNEINRRLPSSGVGLNLAKRLLELMKGQISIESEQGKGTTVITSQPHRFAAKEDAISKATNLTENIR